MTFFCTLKFSMIIKKFLNLFLNDQLKNFSFTLPNILADKVEVWCKTEMSGKENYGRL